MDQTQGDLDHARADLAHGFYDWACFSAQQAAEKAVKAVLQRLGLETWGAFGGGSPRRTRYAASGP
jgi:HEPN domain-containing protein